MQPQMSPVESSQVIVLPADEPTDETVLWLVGEHDMSSIEELSQAIADVADSGRSDLVVDLSRLEFMDSAVIHQLLKARTRFEADGRVARVRDPSPAARYVLEICGLTDLVGT